VFLFPLHHGPQPRGERAALSAPLPLGLGLFFPLFPLLPLLPLLPPCPLDAPGRLGCCAPSAASGGRDRRGEWKLGLEVAIVFNFRLGLANPWRAWPRDRAFLVCGDLFAAGAVERFLDWLLR
jgi:hypothetical protein